MMVPKHLDIAMVHQALWPCKHPGYWEGKVTKPSGFADSLVGRCVVSAALLRILYKYMCEYAHGWIDDDRCTNIDIYGFCRRRQNVDLDFSPRKRR